MCTVPRAVRCASAAVLCATRRNVRTPQSSAPPQCFVRRNAHAAEQAGRGTKGEEAQRPFCLVRVCASRRANKPVLYHWVRKALACHRTRGRNPLLNESTRGSCTLRTRSDSLRSRSAKWQGLSLADTTEGPLWAALLKATVTCETSCRRSAFPLEVLYSRILLRRSFENSPGGLRTDRLFL